MDDFPKGRSLANSAGEGGKRIANTVSDGFGKKGLSDSKQSAGLFFSGRGLSGTRQCGKLVSQASCVSLIRTPLLSQGTGWASGSHSEPASLSQDEKSKACAKTQKTKASPSRTLHLFFVTSFLKATCGYFRKAAWCLRKMQDKRLRPENCNSYTGIFLVIVTRALLRRWCGGLSHRVRPGHTLWQIGN